MSTKTFIAGIDEESGYLFSVNSHKSYIKLTDLILLQKSIEKTINHYKEEGYTDETITELNNQIIEKIYEDFENKQKDSPKPQKSVWIYLMLDSATGYHKIGFSKNPKFREKTLQSEKPTVELLAQYKGSVSDETYLHIFFLEKRIRGEWFALNESDIKEIEFYFANKSNKQL